MIQNMGNIMGCGQVKEVKGSSDKWNECMQYISILNYNTEHLKLI